MVLDGGDWHDRTGSLDLLYRNLGDANVPDLSAVAMLFDDGGLSSIVNRPGSAGGNFV